MHFTFSGGCSVMMQWNVSTRVENARPATVGVLHPGEMGAAIAASLSLAGHRVLWASAGRSAATRARAERAGLEDVGYTRAVAAKSDVVLSVCPPAAAHDVRESVHGYTGIYVDANAVSPDTALRIAAVVEAGGATYVDGGIVGPPPRPPRTTRLYLAGSAADAVAALFAGTAVTAHVLGGPVPVASALKMVFAAWTKGSAALLLATLAAARSLGLEDDLRAEWALSRPELAEHVEAAGRSAGVKGWRWSGEMEEIATTFAAAGLPDGFHSAAAALFARLPRGGEPSLEAVLHALLGREG
jgi:3-hydroxyisobutyrate dehydrogenase-like beta-hydroxyacid dehydrogenase